MEKEELKGYCHACNEFVDYIVKKVNRTVKVRDETLIVETYDCYCSKCGETITVYKYEKINDAIVFDTYKKKVGLLTSSEVREIRKKRGMTQIELARFLGIGDKDITRYESGSIQNKSIDKLLRLVQDDASYEEMLRVFGGKQTHVWSNIVPIIKWGSEALNLEDFFDEKNIWNPYHEVINGLNKKERIGNNYGRERRKEVPLA